MATELNRTIALSHLADQNVRLRLDAARHLVRHAAPEDEEAIRAALANETVAWVRSALARALQRAERSETPNDASGLIEDSVLAEGLYAEAVVEVTGMLLHELEPLLGILRVKLGSEWPGFESSTSARSLDRVQVLLEGIRDLNTASRVPSLESFELSEFLTSLASEFRSDDTEAVATSGPEMVVQSNRGMLHTIVGNALRNAFEARSSTGTLPVLTWNSAAGDEFFIAVLDSGPGPPIGAERAFEIGRSTKEGHLGMGLAIAHRAALALGGRATLRRRPEGGAVFEYRGPLSP